MFANWSHNDPTYTVSYSKISCWADFYWLHLIFCDLIAITALAAFVTRLHPKLYFLHAWFGRGYMISMIWATATSLLIHNTGLPPAVLISFIWTLGGMSIAWILIVLHKQHLRKKAEQQLSKLLEKGYSVGSHGAVDVSQALADATKSVVRSKSWCQRVWSLKTAHGVLMFMSAINIWGRVFASNQSGNFTCHTIPYYKAEFTASGVPEMVPTEDFNYARLPWAKTGLVGWALALSIGPIVFGLVVAMVWAAVSQVVCNSPTKHHDPEKTEPESAK